MPPKGSDLIASSHIPYRQRYTWKADVFHIKPYRGDRRYNFSKLHFVKHGGLASGIKANRQATASSFGVQPCQHGANN